MNAKAYSEVDEILNLISYDLKSSIPKSFLDFIKREKDKDYKPHFDKDIPLEEQNLMEETVHILALLKLKFWCNEEEKIKFTQMLNENERKYQKEMMEKYSTDKLFKNTKEKRIVDDEEKQVTDLVCTQNENFLVKLLRKIKLWIFKK